MREDRKRLKSGRCLLFLSRLMRFIYALEQMLNIRTAAALESVIFGHDTTTLEDDFTTLIISRERRARMYASRCISDGDNSQVPPMPHASRQQRFDLFQLMTSLLLFRSRLRDAHS